MTYVGKQIGLRNATWIPLVTDTPGAEPTWGEAIKLGRAILATLTPTVRTALLESDDGIEDDIAQLAAYGVSIDVSQITQAVKDAVLGHKKDAKGGVTYKDTDVPKYGALVWKSLLSTQDGVPKYQYDVLYRGRFQDLAENFETKRRDSMNFQTHAGLQGNFFPLESTGAIRYTIREDEEGFDEAMAAAWFTTPQFAPEVPEG